MRAVGQQRFIGQEKKYYYRSNNAIVGWSAREFKIQADTQSVHTIQIYLSINSLAKIKQCLYFNLCPIC